MPARRRVVALVDDLMVRSRLEAARGDAELAFPDSVEAFGRLLDPPPDLVLVGLATTRLPWPDLVRQARAILGSATPIVAFGPHRDLELGKRALAAGADRVLANSALMLALPALLGGDRPPAER